MPRSKLDLAANIHDFHYANKYISTKQADKLFYENTKVTGSLGFAGRSAIKLKHSAGLDEFFRPKDSSVLIDQCEGINLNVQKRLKG